MLSYLLSYERRQFFNVKRAFYVLKCAKNRGMHVYKPLVLFAKTICRAPVHARRCCVGGEGAEQRGPRANSS